ncbi:hypothetical protein D3C71_1726930 [compost metagenome]
MFSKIDNVCCSCSTNVKEMEVVWIETVRVVKIFNIIQTDFRAKVSIAKIRPIADTFVFDPQDICQPVAVHVCQINALLRV